MKVFDESCAITGVAPNIIKDLAIVLAPIQYSKDLFKKKTQNHNGSQEKYQSYQQAYLEASHKITNI